MGKYLIATALAAGLCFSLNGFSQVPASAPAGTTALCKDGSFSSSANRQGACHSRNGVQTWYGAVAGVNSENAPVATSSAQAAKPQSASTSNGGSGQVWVNTKTKVYHCRSDKHYGKTKQGQFMSETAAKAAGDHPAHGKSCS
ncbi:DUF3761 domain-containing protein [Burkholderia ubonensis]|uniref:DUF3761 domain-containing protein n=1 Tax=Burkholderia ubonensis TaxID=101571 RepID=UPI0009B4D5CD|nr:DUF3761 domain-containing protein [Burkholderia ubonensis]